MNMKRSLGFYVDEKRPANKRFIQYINLKLAALGFPHYGEDNKFIGMARDLIYNHQEKNRLLSNYLCPADNRIQDFIDKYLSDVTPKPKIRIPSKTFILDHHGLARALSLPPDKDDFVSDIINSYRIKQGILHNPEKDRRTTKGVFHVAEGGLAIPYDKKSVPKKAFAALLERAFNPPKEMMRLPYTSTNENPAELFVSLLLRPKVHPFVENFSKEKSMEIRYFAPGNLVANLDFVESIFGNAGDPYLPENDAALDTEHWTGHTGCVILAPHLTKVTKKEVGLPHFDEATERQKRDSMCWKDENELYNDGTAFKVTARTEEGIIVTLIADNYFGYSKKEVKTQISFSANLYGNAEEEHAGGAIAFPSYNLGEGYFPEGNIITSSHTFQRMIENYGVLMDVKDDGYAVDKKYEDLIYIPENARIDLNAQRIYWERNGEEKEIKLLPFKTYMYPFGYRLQMTKNPSIPSWRLIGTNPEGVFCHKPSTVSGGGKSEISKSISDAIIYGPFFVANYKKDFELVDEIINKDYSDRFRVKIDKKTPSRQILSKQRSLGSVIKLLTPSSEYTDEYNEWLNGIPQYVKGLVFLVKRFYKEEWEGNWREHFSVDIVDGRPGNILKYENRKLVASYLRVGLDKDGVWRTYKLRQDFIAAEKLQMEDDITASAVVPVEKLGHLNKHIKSMSTKFLENCEYRFFQRPDEAINRGYDKQAEADIASPNTFISNFQPLTLKDGIEIIEDSVGFDKYTEPIKKLISGVVKNKDCKYFVSSSHPRIFEGAPSKNMRYLQNRPDIVNPKHRYVAELGHRLYKNIALDKRVQFNVDAVLPGRRNNPPEPNTRPLAVYNPIHYQELPELFMDLICSLTGKSPSTTGAGSEGALTKGPFNALVTTTDLNNALVSFILTGYNAFTTAAGYVGPDYRVDHDISLLIPEIWARLGEDEKNPKLMVKEGYLEKLDDFEHNGQKVLASRLGYRITSKFVHTFFGRVFENPNAVFTEPMLKPELQDIEVFVDGVNNITEAQKWVAENYFKDGSVEQACPPIKALLHIMAKGEYQGKTINDKEIRDMFTLDYLLSSDWYQERLIAKQLYDISLYQKNIVYLENFIKKESHVEETERLGLKERLESAKKKLAETKSPKYIKNLKGTLGLDPNIKVRA